MERVTIKLSDPTKIFWDAESEVRLIGKETATVEPNIFINAAIREGRLIVVSRSEPEPKQEQPAPEMPETPEPAPSPEPQPQPEDKKSK